MFASFMIRTGVIVHRDKFRTAFCQWASQTIQNLSYDILFFSRRRAGALSFPSPRASLRRVAIAPRKTEIQKRRLFL